MAGMESCVETHLNVLVLQLVDEHGNRVKGVVGRLVAGSHCSMRLLLAGRIVWLFFLADGLRMVAYGVRVGIARFAQIKV